MTVNQRIQKLFKHGDYEKIAALIGDTGANVAKKIKGSKEIDSIWLLYAVCRYYEKPIEFFIEDDPTYKHVLEEPVEVYGFKSKRELIEENGRLKDEKDRLKSKLEELYEKYTKLLEK